MTVPEPSAGRRYLAISGDLVERPFSMETLYEQFRDANDADGLGSR